MFAKVGEYYQKRKRNAPSDEAAVNPKGVEAYRQMIAEEKVKQNAPKRPSVPPAIDGIPAPPKKPGRPSKADLAHRELYDKLRTAKLAKAEATIAESDDSELRRKIEEATRQAALPRAKDEQVA